MKLTTMIVGVKHFRQVVDTLTGQPNIDGVQM